MSNPPPKGRGTASNPVNRYAPTHIEPIDDGWYQEVPPPQLTEIRFEQTKTAITYNRSPDISFDRSINPYRGCEHGCIYCFARPSHAYWDLSPGIDFETRLIAKSNLPERLTEELSHPSYRCAPIALGANTDAYQPLERRLKLTRQTLQILLNYRHPVSIVTKGALILRDLDLLQQLAQQRLVHVTISLTTLDNRLKGLLEPRAAAPSARLRTIRVLRSHGIPVSALCAPLILMINDSELEKIISAAADAGAQNMGYTLLRLPWELTDLFEEWLMVHFPDRANHVLSLIRQSRGGQLNDPRFGHRFRGEGPFAALIEQRFRVALKRLGFNQRTHDSLDCSRFSPQQLALF